MAASGQRAGSNRIEQRESKLHNRFKQTLRRQQRFKYAEHRFYLQLLITQLLSH